MGLRHLYSCLGDYHTVLSNQVQISTLTLLGCTALLRFSIHLSLSADERQEKHLLPEEVVTYRREDKEGRKRSAFRLRLTRDDGGEKVRHTRFTKANIMNTTLSLTARGLFKYTRTHMQKGEVNDAEFAVRSQWRQNCDKWVIQKGEYERGCFYHCNLGQNRSTAHKTCKYYSNSRLQQNESKGCSLIQTSHQYLSL